MEPVLEAANAPLMKETHKLPSILYVTPKLTLPSNPASLFAACIFNCIDLLLSHSRQDRYHHVLSVLKILRDCLGERLIRRQLQIILLGTGVSHEVTEAIIRDVDELVVSTFDVGDVGVVRGRDDILKLLPIENILQSERGLIRGGRV